MPPPSLEQQYRTLAEALLVASRRGDWSECNRILEEREQLKYRDSLENRLKILEIDTMTLSVMENERNRILSSLHHLEQGVRMLNCYSSLDQLQTRGVSVEG